MGEIDSATGKIEEIDDLEDTLAVLEALVLELKSQKKSSTQLKMV